jgi:hypothetical protein
MIRLLTADRVRDLFDYDPDTGVLTRKHFLNAKRKRVIGADKAGYIMVSVGGRSYGAHRIIWLWVHGSFPKGQIDHIDGNPSNNRIANLRDVSRSENQKNTRLSQRNKFGVLGVCQMGRTFRATVRANGKDVLLGAFDSLEEAVAVRKAFEQDYGYHENHGRK